MYKAAATGFGQRLNVTFGDKGSQTFQDAMELRNRVTHPKRVDDCWIFEANWTVASCQGEAVWSVCAAC